MKNLLFQLLILTMLIVPSLAIAQEAPIALEVTGVVVSHTPRFKNSAIVNDRIWWEGETIRLRKDDDSWVTLTLKKVEMVEGRGGLLTFAIGEGAEGDPTFQVGLKKSTRWGLHREE